MTRIAPAAVFATLLSLAGAGAAEPAPKAPSPKEQEAYQRQLFERLDADKDGKLTEKEFAVAVLWDDFRKYDADNDGKVTKAEYGKIEKTEDIWSDLDPEARGYVTFEDCLKNERVVKELREEWQALLKQVKRPGARYLTLADLPDLTP